MRILSVKFQLNEDVDKHRIYDIIIGWLLDNEPLKGIGEQFAKIDKKDEIQISDQYCNLKTLFGENKDLKYFAFRLTHNYYEQIWDTDIIYEEYANSKRVIIHVNCSGDITQFGTVPAMRSEIIRIFLSEKVVKNDIFPLQDKPIYTEDSILNLIADVINKKKSLSLPLVYVSRIFDRVGYEVDVDELARKLAGVAYVVAEGGEDFSNRLKLLTDRKNPFGGYIRIYYPSGGETTVSGKDNVNGININNIINDVVKTVTAQVDKDCSTWEDLKSIEAKSKGEMLEVFLNENDSLETKLKKIEEKLSSLAEEKAALQSKYDNLQEAFNAKELKEKLIIKSDVEEFFSGEQHDLLITLLKNGLMTYGKGTRKYELISSFLEKNDYIGEGEGRFDEIKKILSGDAINKQDIQKLEKLGLKLVNSNNHYKFIFMNDDRYVFIVSKTPSDGRGGQNKASDIKNKLSVYS